MTCHRCSGASHVAVQYPSRSPTIGQDRRSARSKKFQNEARPLLHVPARRVPSPAISSDAQLLCISPLISEEIIKSKEELRKLVVIKIISGNASIKTLFVALSRISAWRIVGASPPLAITLF